MAGAPDLQKLVARASAAAGEVSGFRNAGDGTVPGYAADALTDAAYALLALLDQLTCDECGTTGPDVKRHNTAPEQQQIGGVVDMCHDWAACEARRALIITSGRCAGCGHTDGNDLTVRDDRVVCRAPLACQARTAAAKEAASA